MRIFVSSTNNQERPIDDSSVAIGIDLLKNKQNRFVSLDSEKGRLLQFQLVTILYKFDQAIVSLSIYGKRNNQRLIGDKIDFLANFEN